MIKDFKFFRTPFNPRQYDVEGFTFIGVSPICFEEVGSSLSDEEIMEMNQREYERDLDMENEIDERVPRRYRYMIYMDNINHTPLSANIIYEHEEPYDMADVIEVRGNQIFQLPRQEAEYINVTLTFTPNNGL